MDIAEYASRITFRLLQPNQSRPAGFPALQRLARQAGFDLDAWMTILPEGQAPMQRRLRRAMRLRRRSTFAVGALINRAVDGLSPGEVALCLGLGSGFPLFAAMAGHRGTTCVGVDRFLGRSRSRKEFLERFNRWRSPNHQFHQMGSCEYLANVHRGPVGLCLLGGALDYKDRLAALALVEPFLGQGSLLLVEGANASYARRAADAFLRRSEFEFRPLLDVQTPRSGHPTFGNGIQILERGKRKAGEQPAPQVRRRAA